MCFAEGLQCDTEEKVLSHPALQDTLNNPKNGDSAHKHLKQQVQSQDSHTDHFLICEVKILICHLTCCVQSSILGHMEALGLMGGGRCFVEFGAGRGKLSHWIHEALRTVPDLQLLLVERSSTRFKAGNSYCWLKFKKFWPNV